MNLVTAQQMRALEQRADASGNSYAQMMERAGTLTAQEILKRWHAPDLRALVLIGPGNNGGDGLVCARVLHDAGASVRLYVWKRAADENDANWNLCAERNIPILRADDDADFSQLREKLEHAHVVIDALLGTGVTRAIEGTLAKMLEMVKNANKGNEGKIATLVSPIPSTSRYQVIAVDLPTGLDPDTGALDPATVPADLTVTFAFPKIGQYAFPGADAVGELVVADIGIPREWAADIATQVAERDEIRARLPARPRHANKGTFGKAMLACGSLNYTGAPALAAHAAYRAGTGLVTLAVPQAIHPIVAAKIDEATFVPLPDRVGDWRPRGANDLLAFLWDTEYDALLVGCGLGRAESTREFLERLLENLPTLENPPPLVLDADALNHLAGISEWWTRFQFPTAPILTPHPGEMARLLGIKTRDAQTNRVEVARNAAREWNAIVVLKGAFTVIAAPNGDVTLLPFANSALATAGTGDVLAGTIAGLLAQYRAAERRDSRNEKREINDALSETQIENAEPARAMVDSYTAAVVGAYLHALAGEIAAHEIGNVGVVASDLIARLPAALRALRAN